MKNFINLKNNRGFTIVETLVAIAILMIAIAGPLTIAQKGLMASIYAKDQVMASFLAQDAMEYLKNTRDTAILTTSFSSWLNNFYPTCSPNSKCKIDTISGDFSVCNSNNECRLYNDGSSYTTTSGGNNVATPFSRRFYLDRDNVSSQNGTDEARVVVEVTWTNGTIPNVFTIENQFFNVIR